MLPNPQWPDLIEREAMYDVDALCAGLRTYHRIGEVFEIRIIGAYTTQDTYKYKSTLSGYFTDTAQVLNALNEARWPIGGIYHTINPIAPECLLRCPHRLDRTKNATSDSDVTGIRFLPFDIDPMRPTGIPSTEAELARSVDVAGVIVGHLNELGIPVDHTAKSGNGTYVLVRLDNDIQNDGGAMAQGLIKTITGLVDHAGCDIDATVYNPARILRVYGSMNRKGADSRWLGDTMAEQRPHRMAMRL